MNRRFALASCLALASCTPSTNVPGTDLFVDAPDGRYHGSLERLRLWTKASTIEFRDSTTARVYGQFEDGTEVEVSAQLEPPAIYYTVEGEGVALGALDVGRVEIVGVAPRRSTVTAWVGRLHAERTITVVPERPTSLEMTGPSTSLSPGKTGRLTVTATYRTEGPADVTAEATFTSLNESIVTVGEGGVMTAVRAGQAVIVAQIGRLRATFETVVCGYPRDAAAEVRVGQIFPNISWATAFFPNGVEKPLVMEDVHCRRPGFEETNVLLFQLCAQWCGACSPYRRLFAEKRALFERTGTRFIAAELIDVQNVEVVTSERANAYVRRDLGDDWGIAVGDLDTRPVENFFNTSFDIREYPTLLVVRTRDMKVIASSTGDVESFSNEVDAILEDPEAY